MNPVVLTIRVEFIKLFISASLFLVQQRGTKSTENDDCDQSISRLLVVILKQNMPTACLYAVYNNLMIYNLRTMDATTYLILSNTRLIMGAYVWQWAFRKQISPRKMTAIDILTAGLLFQGLGEFKSRETEQIDRPSAPFTYLLHVGLVLAQMMCSVLASVYNEAVLKARQAKYTHLQNACLYADSILLNVGILMLTRSADKDEPIYNAHPNVLLFAIVLLLACIGLVTSFFLRYLDSISKSVASALEVALTTLLGYIVFGYDISPSSAISVALVSAGAFYYNSADGMESGSVRSRSCLLHSKALLLLLSGFLLWNLLDGNTKRGTIQNDLRGGKQFATLLEKREQIKNLQGDNNALEQTKLPSSDLGYLPCCYANHTRCDWVDVAPFTIPHCEKVNLLLLLEFVQDVLGSGTKQPEVEWFISWGTLLGSVRDGAHIPHDTDIDISVDDASWNLMIRRILDGVANTHFVFDDTRHRRNGLAPARLFFSKDNKIHVDFWRHHHYKTTTTMVVNGADGPLTRGNVHNDKLFPLKQCPYEQSSGIDKGQRMYPCPRDSEWYLRTTYGPDYLEPKRKYGPNPQTRDGAGSTWVVIPNHSCPVPKQHITKHNLMKEVIHILEDIGAPYNLHAGTLLGFVRDCEITGKVLDFAIPIEWAREDDNDFKLQQAMVAAGFHHAWGKPLGTLEAYGYEYAWEKKEKDIRVDMFMVKTEKDRYRSGLWRKKKVYKCSVWLDDVATFQWGDVQVRAPVPFEKALTSSYGKDWQKPFPRKWRWFEDAFEVGQCEDKDGGGLAPGMWTS